MPNNRLIERETIKAVRDGRLRIDNNGTVWRIRKWVNSPFSGPCLMLLRRPRRAETIDRNGYLKVAAVIDGKVYAAYANRLIWQHFFGDIPAGLFPRNINNNRSDNRPDNLELAEFVGNSGSYKAGPEHSRWKGGRRVDAQGYVRIYVPPDHPMRMADGTVLEHRLVAAEKIGRSLLSSEIGHHEDEIKDHNTSDNIEVLTRGAHMRHHRRVRFKRLTTEENKEING